MSPANQLQCKSNSKVERSNDRRKLIKYESTDITLADEQHEDMCTLTNKINDVGNEDLQRIFTEGDSYGVGDKVREIWETDSNNRLNNLQKIKEEMVRFTVVSIDFCLKNLS